MNAKSGLEINELFFRDMIQPLLAAHFPALPYAAARLGTGSDVLGYDDETSRDHDWGIRQQLFLRAEDHAQVALQLDDFFRARLPVAYAGAAVHFAPPNAEGTRLPEAGERGNVAHRLEIVTVAGFFRDILGIDPLKPWPPQDWVVVPQQQLLSVTAGRIFHDEIGELSRLRQKFSYFPDQVWRYLLAAQWGRIGQEEHLLGRAGMVGDELGARIIAARLASDLMMITFFLSRQYAPYPKWFGTAFSRLEGAAELQSVLQELLAAPTPRRREESLLAGCRLLLERQNEMELTTPLDSAGYYFFDRPYRVIGAGRIVQALQATITDPAVHVLHPHLGSIDQISDNTDLRSNPLLFSQLHALHQPLDQEIVS